MPPLKYTNVYIGAVFLMLLGSAFGTYFFLTGMNGTSILISNAYGTSTYYLDKNQYDLYLNGLVYCVTFVVASGLFLAVIVVPSANQVQQRVAAPYGSGMQPAGMAPGRPQMAPPEKPQMAPPPQMAQPMAPPQGQQLGGTGSQPKMGAPTSGQQPLAKGQNADQTLEENDAFEEENEERESDSGDADVVYGTGKVTEDSIVEFIHRHPDSAVKFLFRRNLDGKPLQNKEEEIYTVWQKRGLSRNKVRDYVFQIMEWTSMPNVPVHEIWSQLRDQIFELTH
ncbi:hypothetical protein WDW89_20460 [Deltaproteobacteria bacterium TL4]